MLEDNQSAGYCLGHQPSQAVVRVVDPTPHRLRMTE